jgi:hypothetical protein
VEVVVIILVGIGVSLTVASGVWVAVALVRAVFVRNNSYSPKSAANETMSEKHTESSDAGDV